MFKFITTEGSGLVEANLGDLKDADYIQYDIAWYMARCPHCGDVFNMIERHDSYNLICNNGHRL